MREYKNLMYFSPIPKPLFEVVGGLKRMERQVYETLNKLRDKSESLTEAGETDKAALIRNVYDRLDTAWYRFTQKYPNKDVTKLSEDQVTGFMNSVNAIKESIVNRIDEIKGTEKTNTTITTHREGSFSEFLNGILKFFGIDPIKTDTEKVLDSVSNSF